MAKRIDYQPPPAAQPGAREEAEALLEQLHRSGTLRLLNGLFGHLGQVSRVALEGLNSEPGRNATGTLLAAGQVLAHVPADGAERAASGVIAGEQRARYLGKPPGLFALCRLLFSADTRRAIGAILVVLNSVGGAMRRPMPNQPKP